MITTYPSTNAALIAIDAQDRLMRDIIGRDLIINNIKKLLKVSSLLRVNYYFTEQNPGKLGETVDELRAFNKKETNKKQDFSLTGCHDLMIDIKSNNIKKIILCGVETHICIQQSALDLINLGFNVFIVADGVGSRSMVDHDYAIRRLERSGAIVTTTEALIFEWCGTADREEFKAISSIVKGI
tara:strand:+ start:1307 stop:1858 length:552 start_codon:yes stop_codon:yes gene_type:complete